MNKQLLNDVARFQAIAGLQPIGSLSEDITTNEADMGGGMTPDTRAALSAVTMLDANEIEDFLNGLAKYFIHSASDEDDAPKFDAKEIAHHLSQAASVMQAKTGM